FCVLSLFKVGPEAIISDSTGAFVLNGLLTILFTIFFFAGLLLPLLLNFGLLEFFGALLTKVMRPIFTLPGRSSIDCITSWLGDGTLGVMLTNKQYEEGFYSKREAAIISTTFSAVSITFSLIVIDTVGLSHLFIPFYLTVSLSVVIA
ncbi:nucleoside recognition domain-containing protein, partial [Clostridium perfringens]|uniref:nucleoside recognition domain-containing protein n=1 Tax=Clostridium perfringens TaxID=1502 RepID=UPI002AC55E6A